MSQPLPEWLRAGEDKVPAFRVSERPEAIPVDLRRSWRLGVLLLILKNSRANRASHEKLLLLNYGIRNSNLQSSVLQVLKGDLTPFFLQLRVDPALARAVDFGVGVGLFRRLSRGRVELTEAGDELADRLAGASDLLREEKLFLEAVSSIATEKRIREVLSWR